MNERMSKEAGPALEHLLTGLNREQLQSLLLNLAEQEPSVIATIERQARLLQTSSSQPTTSSSVAPPKPSIAVDTKAIRRQVRSSIHSLDRMRSSEAYWHVGGVVNEIRRLVEQVWALIEVGDGRQALKVLEAITEEYMSEWENLDDSDGEASGFFSDLGPAWTEAILSADLTREEREQWADQFAAWQEELDDYGVDEAFDAAETAALDGWDYPPLQRVLQGIITEQGAWEGEPPDYADDLTEARLHILERRGRFQEYLYLAEAEGHTVEYVTMLVRLGRVEEAISYGKHYLATPEEALALAKALYEHGEHEQSLQIAEHGLSLEGRKAVLAKWLRDQAWSVGEKIRALPAAEAAFRDEISLENYLKVAEIAGERWPERRAELLDYARRTKSSYPKGHIDVFLHEGLIKDAFAALDPYASHTLVEQVADAALQGQSHLEWVMQACRRQAEYIMDRGKAELYSSAANWLAKVRKASHMLGREKEWQTYLDELLSQHGRKYKLVPMLKALR
ncbi:MAG TPA: hypothetical protein VJ761_05155 [Ktedonobacteraceae bacterium]|nr:hypothetical protein [Ktedonobacteraceae bacterium]